MPSREVKRVLHVFGQMERGGAESRTMELFRQIDRSRVVFDFVVMKPGEHYFVPEIRGLGGRVFYVAPPAEQGVAGFLRGLVSVMKKDGPFHAVHAHTSLNSGLVLLAARLAGIERRLAHARSAPNESHSGPFRRTYASASRWLIGVLATERIACSDKAGRFLFGRLSTTRGRTIAMPNAIEIERYLAAGQNSPDVRAELGLPSGDFVLGTVGNLRAVKNQSFLIEILAELVALGLSARLLIVGEGPERTALLEQATGLGVADRMVLTGARSDVPDLLGAIDVFVLPSLWEGLPGSVVEAQAARLPCLVSNTVTCEVDAGLGLVQFLPLDGSPAMWAQAACSVRGCERPTRAEARRGLAAGGFDVVESARRLTSIYGL